MGPLIVAVNASPTLGPTVRAAQTLASLLDIDASAVHVGDPSSSASSELAARLSLPMETVAGDPVDQLLAALRRREVEYGVVGRHDRLDPGASLGHVPLALSSRTPRPLLVVPPGSGLARGGSIRRLLLPLDGRPGTTRRVGAVVRRLQRAGVDIVTAHVLEAHDLPAHLDDPGHGFDTWCREFAARHDVEDGALEVRRGRAWEVVPACASEVDEDLVVLAWSQQLDTGRSAVVRAVLAGQETPVLLLPRVADANPSRMRRG